MYWVYLSPHLDDVALSCGGLVWEQAQNGDRVEIWTICAGNPPDNRFSPFAESLHKRWGTGTASAAGRRAEDAASCRELGALYRHFPFPDCIYRRSVDESVHLYSTEESLFGPLHPEERSLVTRLAGDLEAELENIQRVSHDLPCLISPLALGNHVDHQLVRAAAECIDRKWIHQALLFYADYPYVAQTPSLLDDLPGQGWQSINFRVSESGLLAWQKAVAAHTSQISTFWDGDTEMKFAIRAYRDRFQGVRLWQQILTQQNLDSDL